MLSIISAILSKFASMKIKFSKYHGTGNDFIMIDNLEGQYTSLSIDKIAQMCDRKFGIGADGLILINHSDQFDFYVDYYNADGTQSFCGNGARCSVRFARDLGVISKDATFGAIDGKHYAQIESDIVTLDMNDVIELDQIGEDYFMDTGSPHYMHLQKGEDVVTYGRSIRYSDRFKDKGVNVNLIERKEGNKISVQTYERGVEDETLSCGTGVTACALLIQYLNDNDAPVSIETKGGELKVYSSGYKDGRFSDVKLQGPTCFVFKGECNGE